MLKLYKPQQLFVFAFLITIVLGAFTSVFAQWEGWNYRRTVTIDNTSGTALTDFQVKIDLSSLDPPFIFGHANSDGSDLRITSSDGVTQIPFWIESWNTGTQEAIIWVKVPSIPTVGTTIYLYYGNPVATSSSNGTNTFEFFDDFNSGSNTLGYWSGFTAHDWKYSMHMQEGALYYSIIKAQNGWTIESLDAEIEDEFDYMDTQINANGTVTGLSSEPIYCYGLVLSNFALGYSYFRLSNPTLAQRCYDDMVNVYGYIRDTYGTPTTAPDYSLALQGLANACKAFTTYGNTTLADEARGIIVNYVTVFTQSGGGWTAQSGVQDHLKRDFGTLLAYDVTGDATYLTKVRDNIDWILINRWVSSNGGLTWTSPTPTGEFYECHQIWFMIAVRMLYDRNNSYDYLTQGLAAWHFLTDTNYPNIDMYVHNYVNHNAFFSYRLVTSDGLIQPANFKGSYEIGTALWGMSLNYGWVSNYQSSHSTQAYNYLDMMVQQAKNSPANRGYFSTSGNWIRLLTWNAAAWVPDPALWTVVGVTVQLVEDEGSNVLSLRGSASHDIFLRTNNVSFSNFIFETKVKLTQDLNSTCTPEIGFRWTNNNNRYITLLRGQAQNDLFLRKYYNGTGYINATTSFDYNANQYYKYKIVANGNTIGLYLDDVLRLSPTNAGGDVLTGGFCLQNFGTVAVYYDDVRVRSYVAIEPTANVGAEEANPLPVELSTFSASIIGSTVNLQWMTETEVNNYGFEIERKAGSRSSEAGNFKKIGFVEGNGNSNSPKYYSFEDNNLTAGKYSYRLKQIDTDGQFEYSKVIEVELGAPMKYELTQNYPNPFNPTTTIQFSLPESGNVKLTVYNILGEQVAELVNENKEAGVHTINFNASELNSGLYIYKLTAGNFSDVKKLMVVK